MIRKEWTTKEIQFLRENYRRMTIREIAVELDRTYGSVLAKINDLGIKKNVIYAVFENGEQKTTGTADEVANELGIAKRTLHSYATPFYRKHNPDWHVRKI